MTGLITECYPKSTWNKLFAYFKRNNVVTYAGSVDDIDDNTPIFVLDTIRIILNNEKMTVVLNAAKDLDSDDISSNNIREGTYEEANTET